MISGDITAIILVNWNSAADLIECIESILRLDSPLFRVVVVDNGSKDGSLSRLQDYLAGPPSEPDVARFAGVGAGRISTPSFKVANENDQPNKLSSLITFIPLGRNTGFAFANNVGAKFALNDPGVGAIWFLNTDTIVAAGALQHLLRRIDEDPQVGMCGSTLIYYHKPDRIQGVGFKYLVWQARGHQIAHMSDPTRLPDRSSVEAEMTYVIGASMLVTRPFYLSVGPMSESYFLYFEEMDWAVRARPFYRLGWAPDSVVYHKEGGAIGTSTVSDPSAISVFYFHRAIVIFYAKRFPHLIPVALARTIFNGIRFLFRLRPKLAGAVFKGVMAAVTRPGES